MSDRLVPCLYQVDITHSRWQPVRRGFRYRSFMWLVDLDQPPPLPRLLRGLARFCPEDHLDIRAELADRGIHPDRILMLANPRTGGYVFNPISVYWCYDRHEQLLANVAEVHNTYGDRHAYVLLPDGNGRAVVDKAMYVSPFYPVDGSYRIRVTNPAEEVVVTVELERDGSPSFAASLRGERQEATAVNLVRQWTRYPLAGLRNRALIQWQGLRLWRAGLPIQARPSTATPADLERWPGVRPPRRARVRAAVAKLLLRKVVDQTGVRVEFAGGPSMGSPGAPLMSVSNPDAFLRRVGRDGKIGFGEAYMAGDWDSPDLAGLLEPMARDIRTLVPPRLQWIRRFYEPQPPPAADNDRVGARRNISHHYDLSNDLFALFLDRSMTYSSALFDRFDEPLEVAQARKIDRLLDATGVGSGTRLLEIGTGWGELALRAARRGASVKTVTLSDEQAALAQRRVDDAGLADRVTVEVRDYRDVEGVYDAVVSVEMIEAVGESWWPAYFRALDDRLAPGGRIGIQSILMKHEAMLATRRSWTWIHKYVFPGGIIPSIEAMEQAVKGTRLRLNQRYHFGPSYAETIKRWRQSFDERASTVEALGFDWTFRRMWDFYLAYSEAGFRSGHLDVAQLIFTRDGAA